MKLDRGFFAFYLWLYKDYVVFELLIIIKYKRYKFCSAPDVVQEH